MADPVDVAIESALLNRAVAFANSQSPAINIALPNVADFTPPVATPTAKYLRATFLPAPTNGLGLSTLSTNQLYGFLQIDVFWGLNAGELAPSRLASAILAYFKFQTTVTKDGFIGTVWKQPYRSPMMISDAWMQIPVTIPYIAFAPNPA